VKSSAPSPFRLYLSIAGTILPSLLLTTSLVACATPRATAPIPPRIPQSLLDPCPDPILTGDVATDLVHTEEQRLCERADKEGIRVWQDELRPTQTEEPHGLRGFLGL